MADINDDGSHGDGRSALKLVGEGNMVMMDSKKTIEMLIWGCRFLPIGNLT